VNIAISQITILPALGNITVTPLGYYNSSLLFAGTPNAVNASGNDTACGMYVSRDTNNTIMLSITGGGEGGRVCLMHAHPDAGDPTNWTFVWSNMSYFANLSAGYDTNGQNYTFLLPPYTVGGPDFVRACR
jgi:hypothetical protein